MMNGVSVQLSSQKHIQVTCQVQGCRWWEPESRTLRQAKSAARLHVEHARHAVCISTTVQDFYEPEQEN